MKAKLIFIIKHQYDKKPKNIFLKTNYEDAKKISCKIDFTCIGSVDLDGYLIGLLSVYNEVSYDSIISVPENRCRMHWEGSKISKVPIRFKAIG